MDAIMRIAAEVAGLAVTQLRFEVNSHETWSPANGLYVNTALFALITLFALTFHWYKGFAPPLTGVAVKVTADPGQNGLVEAEIVIPAGKFALTTNATWFDRTGFPVEQA
jgi:hypothetical protein